MSSSSLHPANTPYVAFKRAVSRRRFLAGTGVLLALPMLDAMTPAFAAAVPSAAKPRRMLGICNNLGLVPDYFFPTGKGKDYRPHLISSSCRAIAKTSASFRVSRIRTSMAAIRPTTASSLRLRTRAAGASVTPSRSISSWPSASGTSRVSRR